MAFFTPEHCGELHGSVMCAQMSDISLFEAMEYIKTLKKLKEELEEALEKADTEVMGLMLDIRSLREENRSLQKMGAQQKELSEELETMRLSLEHSEEVVRAAKLVRKELEERCAQAEKTAEELTHQVSDTLDQNKFLQNKVTSLNHLNTELESNLQKMKLELKKKEEIFQKRATVLGQMTQIEKEYSDIIEVLHHEVKTLQRQLNQTQQEISLNKTNNLPLSPAESGTLMYELVQEKLEKQLLQSHMEKERRRLRGFLGLRMLSGLVIQLLWCYFLVFMSVSFLLLVFWYILHQIQAQHPGFLSQLLLCIVTPQTLDSLQETLQAFLLLEGSVPV